MTWTPEGLVNLTYSGGSLPAMKTTAVDKLAKVDDILDYINDAVASPVSAPDALDVLITVSTGLQALIDSLQIEVRR